jgi:hypothetical protein
MTPLQLFIVLYIQYIAAIYAILSFLTIVTMHAKLSFAILNLFLYSPLGKLLMIHLNLFEQHDVNHQLLDFIPKRSIQ